MNSNFEDIISVSLNDKKLVSAEQLRAGDVILCYKGKKIDVIGRRIQKVTGSSYTHAAIYLSSGKAAESKICGVKTTDIYQLVNRYMHVAIFRQPLWNSNRVKRLELFVEELLSKGAKYNSYGVLKFGHQRNIFEQTIFNDLNAFFEGKLIPPSPKKKHYFCSELVVDCFIYTGIIQPSAAVVYRSNVTSPGALGKDPTFGYFYGYLSCIENYQIPETDEFFDETTFNEIFGDEK
ncbi:MAG TPA: hypothetical protein VK186_27615 [Candidatus Deferrimicrobium sp.]|nr:hypothetical protein [Candidatus Deferrimicrobium sp.]